MWLGGVAHAAVPDDTRRLCVHAPGEVGFSSFFVGGPMEPPKTGGGGGGGGGRFGKGAQLTGPLISDFELWRQRRQKILVSFENGQFLSPNPWQMMTFLNPLDALIPKIPFSFFAEFWVRVTSGAWGSVPAGFCGGPSIEPFLGDGGEGGVQADASPRNTPKPPEGGGWGQGCGHDCGAPDAASVRLWWWWWVRGWAGRDALEWKGPQRRPRRRLDRRLEEVAEAVGGGSCRLSMLLKQALGARATVAGRRLGALEGRGGVSPPSNASEGGGWGQGCGHDCGTPDAALALVVVVVGEGVGGVIPLPPGGAGVGGLSTSGAGVHTALWLSPPPRPEGWWTDGG